MYVSDFLTAAASAHRDELIKSARRRETGGAAKRRRLFRRERRAIGTVAQAAPAPRARAGERVLVTASCAAPSGRELTAICGR